MHVITEAYIIMHIITEAYIIMHIITDTYRFMGAFPPNHLNLKFKFNFIAFKAQICAP